MRGIVWNDLECGLQDMGLAADSGDSFIFEILRCSDGVWVF